MTYVVQSPNVLRDWDELERRVAAIERMLVAYGLVNYTVTPGYTADRAFNPESTSLTEVARVLGTLIDDLKNS